MSSLPFRSRSPSPCSARRRPRPPRRVILSGWVTQGPEVAAFEQEFAALRRRAARLRRVELHDGAAPGAARPSASAPATRSSPSATPSSPPPTRSATAAPRRSSSTSSRTTYNIDPALDRGGDHAADQGDPRASTRSACRATSRRIVEIGRRARHCRSSRTRPAPSAARSCWNGEWERIGRPHGDVACFSFHPRKVITTGDGGMLTTADPELRSQVPPAAPARHERARHASGTARDTGRSSRATRRSASTTA